MIRVRTDIAVFASLSKDRDLGPRLQLVKKMECGLVHGQECKMECGLVHGQECKMECGLVHGQEYKMECGLVHGQEYKMECGLVHGQEYKMECGLVHGQEYKKLKFRLSKGSIRIVFRFGNFLFLFRLNNFNSSALQRLGSSPL